MIDKYLDAVNQVYKTSPTPEYANQLIEIMTDLATPKTNHKQQENKNEVEDE